MQGIFGPDQYKHALASAQVELQAAQERRQQSKPYPMQALDARNALKACVGRQSRATEKLSQLEKQGADLVEAQRVALEKLVAGQKLALDAVREQAEVQRKIADNCISETVEAREESCRSDGTASSEPAGGSTGGISLGVEWHPAACTTLAAAARAAMPLEQADIFLTMLEKLIRGAGSVDGNGHAAGVARSPAAELAEANVPGLEYDASKREQADCVPGEETRKIPKTDAEAGSTPNATGDMANGHSRAAAAATSAPAGKSGKGASKVDNSGHPYDSGSG